MERIKDFLYDISDLFFSLLIIGLIFFVVSLKLNDTMADTWFSNINQSDIDAVEFEDIEAPNLELPLEEDDLVSDVDEPVEVIDEPDPPISEVKEVTFEILPGTSGYKIATNLKSNQLIQDIEVFIQTLDEMKLGNKLRAGSHKLSTDMTVEAIILKLTGQ